MYKAGKPGWVGDTTGGQAGLIVSFVSSLPTACA